MVTMPVDDDFKVTSPYGPRTLNGRPDFHRGIDFGNGASGNCPVYAPKAGRVIFAGAARGYGGPDPAGWLVIDHPAEVGGGCTELGHIICEVNVGDWVEEGQRVGRINPDPATNGGCAPHLHASYMLRGYDPNAKVDPAEHLLPGAKSPNGGTPPPAPEGVIFGIDISEHQDGLALRNAAADGIEFVILRLCDGTYRDKTFHSHLEDAENNGLLVSTYWYLRAPVGGHHHRPAGRCDRPADGWA